MFLFSLVFQTQKQNSEVMSTSTTVFLIKFYFSLVFCYFAEMETSIPCTAVNKFTIIFHVCSEMRWDDAVPKRLIIRPIHSIHLFIHSIIVLERRRKCCRRKPYRYRSSPKRQHMTDFFFTLFHLILLLPVRARYIC